MAERRARGEARRRAILDATLRLVVSGGPHAVSHRAVAAEAGVPLAATTYYFASRDELIAETLALAADRELTALGAALDGAPPPRDAAEAARRLVDLSEEVVTRDPVPLLAKFELYLAAARSPLLRDTARRWTEVYVEQVARILRSLGSPSPEDDARVVVWALDGAYLQRVAEDRASPAELHARIERLLAALVGTPPGTPDSPA